MKNNGEDIGALEKIEMDFLFAEINRFLDHLYVDLAKALAMRVKEKKLDDKSAFAFFRSKERLDNVKLILQYLIYYNTQVDFKNETKEDLEKPFMQFKEAIRRLFNQLLEKDVQTAVFREMINNSPLEQHSMERFEHKITSVHNTLVERWYSADSPSEENLLELLEGLMKYMRFWFELRGHDINHIRKSDIYVFKLSKLLYCKK